MDQASALIDLAADGLVGSTPAWQARHVLAQAAAVAPRARRLVVTGATPQVAHEVLPQLHDLGWRLYELAPSEAMVIVLHRQVSTISWAAYRTLVGRQWPGVVAAISDAQGGDGEVTFAAGNAVPGWRRWAKGVARKADKSSLWLQNKLLRYVGRQTESNVKPTPAALHAKLLDVAAQMPHSNGSQYHTALPLRLGIISDDILFNALKDLADVVPLTQEDCMDTPMDAFLFVACWNGMEQWPRIGQPQAPSRLRLYALLDALRAKGVPTLFWSIEDPPHYGDFIGVAKRCSHVFTTAAEMVDAYIRDCGTTRVAAMPFGVNPVLHNPIGSVAHKASEGAFFAGSWYRQYPERAHDMAMMFDGVLGAARPLVVVDRCYYRNSASFRFPARFRPHTLPPMAHMALQSLPKAFRWCLNFSSVKRSTTMMANRVPELLAQGAAVISNDALSVHLRYPQAFIAREPATVASLMQTMTALELRHICAAGTREVMEGQTYFETFGAVFCGLGLVPAAPTPRILVIADQPDEHLRACCAAQLVGADIQFVGVSAVTLADLREADVISVWSARHRYREYYLQDLLHVFRYASVAYATCGDAAHEYVTGDVRLDRSLLWSRQWDHQAVLAALRELGTAAVLGHADPGYSVGVLELEDAANPAVHLVPDVAQPRMSAVIWFDGDAKHLFHKTCLSLRRSELGAESEVFIQPLGTPAPKDQAYLARMARHYGNVRINPPSTASMGTPEIHRLAADMAARAVGRHIIWMASGAEFSEAGVAKLRTRLRHADDRFRYARCLVASPGGDGSTAGLSPASPIVATTEFLRAHFKRGMPATAGSAATTADSAASAQLCLLGLLAGDCQDVPTWDIALTWSPVISAT